MTEPSVVIVCRNIDDDISILVLRKGIKDGNSVLIKRGLDYFNILKDAENVTLEERIAYFKIFVTFEWSR